MQDGFEEELSSWELVDARRGVGRANVSLGVAPGTRAGAAALLAAGALLAPALRAARAAPAAAADPVRALRPLAVACVLLDYLQVSLMHYRLTCRPARGNFNGLLARLMVTMPTKQEVPGFESWYGRLFV